MGATKQPAPVAGVSIAKFFARKESFASDSTVQKPCAKVCCNFALHTPDWHHWNGAGTSKVLAHCHSKATNNCNVHSKHSACAHDDGGWIGDACCLSTLGAGAGCPQCELCGACSARSTQHGLKLCCTKQWPSARRRQQSWVTQAQC